MKHSTLADMVSGRRVHKTSPDETVRNACIIMTSANVGALPVMDDKGVLVGIHQEVLPSEEDAFIEKWIQPYEKLVQQPIWYKAGPVPHGFFRCTLPQALARGFAVGSIQRAKKILKQRGHMAHGA